MEEHQKATREQLRNLPSQLVSRLFWRLFPIVGFMAGFAFATEILNARVGDATGYGVAGFIAFFVIRIFLRRFILKSSDS